MPVVGMLSVFDWSEARVAFKSFGLSAVSLDSVVQDRVAFDLRHSFIEGLVDTDWYICRRDRSALICAALQSGFQALELHHQPWAGREWFVVKKAQAGCSKSVILAK